MTMFLVKPIAEMLAPGLIALQLDKEPVFVISTMIPWDGQKKSEGKNCIYRITYKIIQYKKKWRPPDINFSYTCNA